MMALRDHLRAEEHCPVRLGEPRQPFRELGRVRGNVRVEADELEPGKAFRQLLFEPLRPGAEPGELRGPAGRTEGGAWLSPSAVVAVECAVPVQRECDVAARAADGRPAG